MSPHRYAIGAILLLIPIIAFPAILHVPGDYSTIQSGIDAAGDGDTILIADGTYSGPGNIDIEWDATTKHLLIMSENGRDHCIIDCMQEGRGFLLNNGQDHRDVIDGLTITRGMVLGPGGAILIAQASPTIRNCMLAGNSAEGYHDNSYSGGGGAIMVYGAAAPHIQNNIIRDNVAHNQGGGLLFAEYATGEVRNNIIDGNKSLDDWGGGIALWNNSSPLIIKNLISHNSCSGFDGGRGGGIYLGNSLSRLINNTIAYNATTGNEYGPGYGGGISISNWSSPVIENCIIWYNMAGPSTMNIDFDPMEWLDLSYCSVENDLGYIFELEPHTNMDTPPEFADTVSGDYQLLWKSPCINKGDPDTTGMSLPPLDLSGTERIYEGRVDMGAYEYNRPTSIPENRQENEFQLYPNPGPGTMFLEDVENAEHEDLMLRIFNIRGEIVHEESLDEIKSLHPIDISNQPGGIYVLSLVSKGELLYRQKIIKE